LSCSIVAELHFHYFLVSRNNFIAHLHEHLKLEFRALCGQDGGMQIVSFAGQKLLHTLIGGTSGRLHFIDRAA